MRSLDLTVNSIHVNMRSEERVVSLNDLNSVESAAQIFLRVRVMPWVNR